MSTEDQQNEKMAQLLFEASIIRGLTTMLATQSAVIEALLQVPQLVKQEPSEFSACLERAISGLDKGLEHMLAMKNALSDRVENDPALISTEYDR